MAPGRRKPAAGHRQRLVVTLTRLTVLSVVMMVACPWLLWRVLDMSPALSLASMLFFIERAVRLWTILRRVRRVDFGEMCISDAQRVVYGIERSLLTSRVVGFCLGIPLLGWMLYDFRSVNEGAFLGGCCGLVVGLIVGWLTYRRMRDDLRRIRSDIEAD